MAYAEFIERGYGREDTGDWTAGMTAPPPGGWQPYQPGQTPPSYGTPPGNFPPPGPPPGYQQGQWPQQPQPPKGGNTTKWLLIAVAVLLVIGVTIGATLLFTRGTGDATTNPSSAQNASDFASAGDVGPVGVITTEPTCTAFSPLNNTLAALQAKGWSEERGKIGPASEWSESQREQMTEVATAISNSTAQLMTFAKQTPNRVVRELYQQAATYGQKYSDSLATYKPADNFLADVYVNASSAVTGVCNAIEYGVVQRSLTVPPAGAPAGTVDAADSSPFVSSSNSSACGAWIQREDQFTADTSAWAAIDGETPGLAWSPEQRATIEASFPTFTNYAEAMQAAGAQSDNSILNDFATAAAQYTRAYVASAGNYEAADSWLYFTGFRFANTVTGACKALDT